MVHVGGAIALFLASLVWFVVGVSLPAARDVTGGFSAYYAASHLLVHGEISSEIYDPRSFQLLVEELTAGRVSDIYNSNPPTTSLLSVPVVWLPIKEARGLWTVLSILMLLGGLALLLRHFAPAAGIETWMTVLTVGLLFRPVIANVRYGQAYILIFILLALAVTALDRGRDAAGGLAVGFSLMLKTAGWAMVPLLVWQRRWRFAASTIATSAAIWIATLPWLPWDMWRTYLRVLPETTSSPLVCVTAYQTTRSFLCHLFQPAVEWTTAPAFDPPVAARFLFVTLAVGTVARLLVVSAESPTVALLGSLAWGVIFAPLGEEHHHVVVLVPLTWLMLQTEARGWMSRGTLMAAVALYLVPWPINEQGLQLGWWAVLAYPRLVAAWLVMLLLLCRRAPGIDRDELPVDRERSQE